MRQILRLTHAHRHLRPVVGDDAGARVQLEPLEVDRRWHGDDDVGLVAVLFHAGKYRRSAAILTNYRNAWHYSRMLIHGDCLDVMPTLPDASVDMVFADLPYGVTANKWDAIIPFAPLWTQLLRIGKPNCAFVFTATQPFTSALINSSAKLFKYTLVWDKVRAGRHLSAKFLPLARHEDVVIFCKKTLVYNPQMMLRDKPRIGRAKNTASSNYIEPNRVKYNGTAQHYTHRYPTTIITAVKDTKPVHPTQKPVALLEWLIKTYTHEGDTVLDPTAGSGTTAVAAINTNRKYICIERDATYYATAAKRIAEALTQPHQQAMAL